MPPVAMGLINYIRFKSETVPVQLNKLVNSLSVKLKAEPGA